MKTKLILLIAVCAIVALADRPIQAATAVELVGAEAAADMLPFAQVMLKGTQLHQEITKGWATGRPAERVRAALIAAEIRQEEAYIIALSDGAANQPVSVFEVRLRLAAIRITNAAIRSFVQFVPPAQQSVFTTAAKMVDRSAQFSPRIIDAYREEDGPPMTIAFAQFLAPQVDELDRQTSAFVALAVTPGVFVNVAFAGMAVDVGRLMVVKGQLSKAADEAALGGGRVLTSEVKTPVSVISYYIEATTEQFEESATPEYEARVAGTLAAVGEVSEQVLEGIEDFVLVPHEYDCNDRLDNDGDLLTDCEDEDCGGRTCVEADCANREDDDGDGAVDCEDDDCANDPACQGGASEICDNRLDDDADQFIDCADPDCDASPVCCADCVP